MAEIFEISLNELMGQSNVNSSNESNPSEEIEDDTVKEVSADDFLYKRSLEKLENIVNLLKNKKKYSNYNNEFKNLYLKTFLEPLNNFIDYSTITLNYIILIPNKEEFKEEFNFYFSNYLNNLDTILNYFPDKKYYDLLGYEIEDIYDKFNKIHYILSNKNCKINDVQVLDKFNNISEKISKIINSLSNEKKKKYYETVYSEAKITTAYLYGISGEHTRNYAMYQKPYSKNNVNAFIINALQDYIESDYQDYLDEFLKEQSNQNILINYECIYAPTVLITKNGTPGHFSYVYNHTYYVGQTKNYTKNSGTFNYSRITSGNELVSLNQNIYFDDLSNIDKNLINLEQDIDLDIMEFNSVPASYEVWDSYKDYDNAKAWLAKELGGVSLYDLTINELSKPYCDINIDNFVLYPFYYFNVSFKNYLIKGYLNNIGELINITDFVLKENDEYKNLKKKPEKIKKEINIKRILFNIFLLILLSLNLYIAYTSSDYNFYSEYVLTKGLNIVTLQLFACFVMSYSKSKFIKFLVIVLLIYIIYSIVIYFNIVDKTNETLFYLMNYLKSVF